MLFTVPQNFEFFKYFFQSFFDVTRSSQEQQLFKFTTLGSVCQELFQKFLRLASVISAATILGYHILWLLSSVFFISLCGAVLTAPTALLEYQIIPRLSTPFFNFLRFFYFSLLRPLIPVLPLCILEINLCKTRFPCYNASLNGIYT